jgi:phenylpropionate dioxygenase-like ring-hydroxylating dioxygenase large terminal subunit
MGRPDETAFDWQNCWYPVSFFRDVPKDSPAAFMLYDKRLVLFVDDVGRVICLRDRCPHRAARLSDGQIVNGRLECLYHGWQFGADGQCLRIPQLLAGKEIPGRSRVQSYPTVVQQGIVWIWAGDPDRADQNLIPKTPNADDATFSVTFQMDLPYDQSYLIENVIDVAHIHIAHHGMRGGGLREAAKPLEFKIIESEMGGIRSAFRSVGLVRPDDAADLSSAIVEYVAPNLVRYVSKYRDPHLVAGLELFSLPLGRNRCRLLYRKYSNFASILERLKPRWLEHLTQCAILEQDMAVVVGQSEEIEREGANLKDIWMPLKTSDRLVIEYRKWLDRFGGSLPSYRGFATRAECVANVPMVRPPTNRHVLHTRLCSTCGRMYRGLDRSIKVLWFLVTAAFAAGMMVEHKPVEIGFILVGVAGLLAIGAAHRLKSCF